MKDVSEVRNAVVDLLYRYAEAVDDGDFAALRKLFCKARLYAGDVEDGYQGADGVTRMFQEFTIYYDRSEQPVNALETPGTPRTTHLISNPIVEVAADLRSARSRSRFTVFQCLSDFPLQAIIQGRYDDHFCCEDGQCYFVSRRYYSDFSGDLSRHLHRMP